MYIKFYISQDRLGYTTVTIKPNLPMASLAYESFMFCSCCISIIGFLFVFESKEVSTPHWHSGTQAVAFLPFVATTSRRGGLLIHCSRRGETKYTQLFPVHPIGQNLSCDPEKKKSWEVPKLIIIFSEHYCLRHFPESLPGSLQLQTLSPTSGFW